MSDTVDELAYKADVRSRVRENISERIATVKGTIANAVGGVRSTMTGKADVMMEQAGGMTGTVRERASAAVENPLGLALAAFGVGLVAGLVMPMTRVEHERLGPVREQVTRRAQTAAAEAVEAGKSLLGETVANVAASAGAKGQEIAEHAVSGTGE